MPLRLGTFNVWGLPGSFARDVSSRMRRLASRLRGLDLDVLLLQEAWTDEVKDTLQRAAQGAGFFVADGGASTGGLMVLSRLPILSSRFEAFRFRGDPERLSQGEFLGGKGFQTIALNSDRGPVHLINTHLHACYRRSRPELNSAVRTAQLLQIVGVVNHLNGTAIVGGDFNCTHRDLEYEIFVGLTRATELGDGRSFPTVSKRNFYKRHRRGRDKRIDYLFARGSMPDPCRSSEAGLLFAGTERIGRNDRSLSDHYGFRANLELDPATGQVATRPHGISDPGIFDRARGLLALGRDEADRRERKHFVSAGSWAGAAILAAGVRRHPALNRRRFVKSVASAAAAMALMPTVGYGALARLDSDSKRDAFDDAHEILVALESKSNQGTA